MKKQTIKDKITFKGRGLHTGEESVITLYPSDSGKVVFIKKGKRIPADIKHVKGIERGVSLSDGEIKIFTVEHLLSALYGMGIDSVEVIMEKGNEIPALDGSALEFAHAIYETGKKEIEQEDETLEVKSVIELQEDGKFIKVEPFEGFEIVYTIIYPKPLDIQRYAFKFSHKAYLREIAPARTFVFKEELEEVFSRGLGRGGSLSNVVVFSEEEQKVLNPPLRFEDEPVRHKVLDFIGDISLTGRRLQGRYTVYCAGHRLHLKLARYLMGIIEEAKRNEYGHL